MIGREGEFSKLTKQSIWQTTIMAHCAAAGADGDGGDGGDSVGWMLAGWLVD